MLGSGPYLSQDRRNRRATAKKAAQGSHVSLLSAITASSSGSSGSGSTVTQESLSRSRARTFKNNANLKGRRQKALATGTSTIGRSSSRKDKGVLDVFAFLEKDQSRSTLVPPRPSGGQSHVEDGMTPFPHHDSDLESNPPSFHSDSGISINDHISDPECPKKNRSLGKRPGKGRDEQHIARKNEPAHAEQTYSSKLHPIPQDLDEDHPEYYYGPNMLQRVAEIPAVGSPDTDSIPVEGLHLSGYDLLASWLSPSKSSLGDSLPPLYRRFGRLNHRILLQLQDEIAEMEEDLHHMDQWDARERAAQHGSAMPASRRLDWQWRGSELHARRLELLGRIYMKVEQYNQALSSFQRVASSTSPAQSGDIESYRKWMAENRPVADAEAAYLEKENDLLDLTKQQCCTDARLASSAHLPTLLMTFISATACPVLLFRIFTGFTCRCALILLLVPSAAFIAKAPAVGSLFGGKENRQILLFYLGALVFAALVI